MKRPYIDGDRQGLIYPRITLRRVSIRCRLSHHCWHGDKRSMKDGTEVVVMLRCCRCYARDWAYEESPAGLAARESYYGERR